MGILRVLLAVSIVLSLGLGTLLVSESSVDLMAYRVYEGGILWYAGPGTKSDQHSFWLPPSCQHLAEPGDTIDVAYGWNRLLQIGYSEFRNVAGERAADPERGPIRYWIIIWGIAASPVLLWLVGFLFLAFFTRGTPVPESKDGRSP